MIDRPHQRKGSKSNAHVGRDFEQAAQSCLKRNGIPTLPNFKLKIGVSGKKKEHGFDLGSSVPLVVVECKSHRWTEGDKVPSAKMTTWNEAMYFFSLIPASTRRILFVLRDERRSTGETLVDYYLRIYGHLIPSGVELWEFNEVTRRHKIYNP